jgi:ubiquinone/menaquinone biosynthesis C-methylase UbiE
VSYWDRVAHEKRFSHPVRLDWLTRYLKPDARILDCGCGYGRTLIELTNSGYQNILGVDFSQAMLQRCRADLPQTPVIRNDGQTLPLTSNSIDAVILFAVLTCIPADADQRALISEIARVLNPGGCLYVSDLLLNDDERNRERYESYLNDARPRPPTSDFRPPAYGVFALPEGVVVRHHSIEWIEELTRNFEQLEYAPLTVTTMNGNSSSAFQYLGRKTIP